MAGKQVNFELDVNAGKAEQGLRQFAQAVKKANKTAADSFDDTSTAGERAAKTIADMARKMDADMRDAASAADALATALGPELTSRMDVKQVTDDLNRMGLSFDEIRADADKLAGALREVDGVRLQQVNDGLSNTGDQLEELDDAARRASDGVSEIDDAARRASGGVNEISDSGRGANSALANMVGNSAQDLGALGGLAGSAGVAIGQMAEYAADATLAGEKLGSALRSMAGVVGPIAALTAGVAIVSKVMGGFSERAELSEEHMQRLNDLAAEGGDVIGNYAASLADVGTESTDAQQSLAGFTEMFFGMNTGITDVSDSLDAAGVTFRDFARGVTGTVSEAQALQLAFDQAAAAGLITQAQWEALTSALAQSRNEWGTTAEGVTKANRLLAVSTRDVNDALHDLAVQEDPLAALFNSSVLIGTTAIDAGIAWQGLVKDLADGQADVKETGQLVTQFADIMHMSVPDVLALATAQGEGTDAGVDYTAMWSAMGEAISGAQTEADRMTFTQFELAEAMKATADPMKTMPDQWRALIQDFRDGQFDLEGAVGSINAIAEATGKEPGEIFTLIAEGAAEANTAADDMAKSLDEAQVALDAFAGVDMGQVASGLQDALDVTDDFVDHIKFAEDFQHEFDDVLKAGDEFVPDLRELLDLQAQGIEITPEITLGELESDDAEALAWAQGLRDMVQEGAVEAFEHGGTESANAFVQAQAKAFHERHPEFTEADFYRLIGLGPNGEIDVLVNPVIATQKLNAIQPIIDQLVSSGAISPEIALKISALEIDDPEAALALAVQVLEAAGIEVPIQLRAETDTAEGDIHTVADADYTATINTETPDADATNTRLNGVADGILGRIWPGGRGRLATYRTEAPGLGNLNTLMDAVANKPRTAHIRLDTNPDVFDLNHAIDFASRNRTTVITLETHSAPAAGGGGGGGGDTLSATGLSAAPTAAATTAAATTAVTMAAPAPSSFTANVTINAGVLGNHFDVERTVTRALRRSARINGRRAVSRD